MAVVKELIRTEENGGISFGNYELTAKSYIPVSPIYLDITTVLMIVILGKDILPSTSATISTVLRIRKNVLLTLALLRQLIPMPPSMHR